MRRMLRFLLVCLLACAPIAAQAKIPGKSKRGPNDFLLVAGGDVAYPRGWMDRLVERQKGKMFANVRGYAKAADLAFLNLESPYTDAEFFLKKKWPIATPPHRLDYVLDGGFNMFSLANNHMFDAGEQGIKDTLDLLEAKRKERGWLVWTGAALKRKDVWKPAIFTVPGKNIKVAFHAFGYARSSLVPVPYGPKALAAIRTYDKQVDITIVSVHHGKEYIHVPSEKKAVAYRKYVDAGADVVLGHHPHVIQGVEAYKDAIIFHSLGNFSFASKTRRHHKTGAKLYSMLPLIYIKDGKVERAEILPLYVNNSEKFEVGDQVLKSTNFKPQIVTGVFAKQVLTDLKGWTRKLPGVNKRAVRAYKIRGDRAVIQVRR
jgi:hypothetical protein